MYYLGGDRKEEKDYHDNWVSPLYNRKVMIPLFNKKVVYKNHPKVDVYGFYIFNEKLVKFFEQFGIKAGSKINVGIPEGITKNNILMRRFIRGLFDTDGTIYFDKNRSAKDPINNRPAIKLTSVSRTLILQTLEILNLLGFNPRLMLCCMTPNLQHSSH